MNELSEDQVIRFLRLYTTLLLESSWEHGSEKAQMMIDFMSEAEPMIAELRQSCHAELVERYL